MNLRESKVQRREWESGVSNGTDVPTMVSRLWFGTMGCELPGGQGENSMGLRCSCCVSRGSPRGGAQCGMIKAAGEGVAR